MSYRPKRVFVKNENGAYTELTYQEFRTGKDQNPSLENKKVFRLCGDTFMAVDKKEHTFISSFTRHLRHLKSSNKIHKLEFYAEVPVGINVNENQDICSVEDELEHKMMIDKLRSCIPKLTQKQQDLVQYFYFDCLT